MINKKILNTVRDSVVFLENSIRLKEFNFRAFPLCKTFKKQFLDDNVVCQMPNDLSKICILGICNGNCSNLPCMVLNENDIETSILLKVFKDSVRSGLEQDLIGKFNNYSLKSLNGFELNIRFLEYLKKFLFSFLSELKREEVIGVDNRRELVEKYKRMIN